MKLFMVDFEEFLSYLKSQDYYHDQIYHIEQIPSQDAHYGILKKPLKIRLQRWLDINKIKLH